MVTTRARQPSRTRYRAVAEAARSQGGVAVDDDRLPLIFACCHPALALEARIALTLRYLSRV